jgi:hypothetical protein
VQLQVLYRVHLDSCARGLYAADIVDQWHQLNSQASNVPELISMLQPLADMYDGSVWACIVAGAFELVLLLCPAAVLCSCHVGRSFMLQYPQRTNASQCMLNRKCSVCIAATQT